MNRINRCIFCGQPSLQQQQAPSHKRVVFNDIIKTLFDKICLDFRVSKYGPDDVHWVASLMSVNKATMQQAPKILSSTSYKTHFVFTAMKYGHTLVFRALLKMGPDSGLNPNRMLVDFDNCSDGPYRVLTHAILGEHANIVRILIESKANLDFQEPFSWIPELGYRKGGTYISLSPFLLAVSKGYIDIAKMLQRAGADIKALSDDAEGALTIAFKTFSLSRKDRLVEAMKALLQMPGLELNAYEGFHTPLINMIRFLCKQKDIQEEQMQALRFLIQAGANIQAVSLDYTTSTLMWAALSGHPEIVQIFIESLKSIRDVSCSSSSMGISGSNGDFANPRLVKDILERCKCSGAIALVRAKILMAEGSIDQHENTVKRNKYQIIYHMLLELQKSVESQLNNT